MHGQIKSVAVGLTFRREDETRNSYRVMMRNFFQERYFVNLNGKKLKFVLKN
jgi:hypothetical protein